MKIIGHRGAAGLALENSPAGIRKAAKMPIAGIELDVRITKDEQLVLLHDSHTGRVADKKRYVSESTFAELQQLRLKNGERILLLDEALQLVGSKQATLDIKASGVWEELVRVVARHPKADIIVSSQRYGELGKIHKALPGVPFLVQSHLNPTEAIDIAHQMRATGISLNKWLMNPFTYHLAERTGLEIRAYTINHRWLMNLFAKFYPNVTVYTDYPNKFLDLQEK